MRLPAKLPFGSHFAGHACDFGGERVQLVHHGVDGFFQQQNFATHIHCNFLGEIAACDRRRDLGNVSHLAGQVAGHRIDRVGEIFPCAANALHNRLTSQLAVSSNFAGNARHF